MKGSLPSSLKVFTDQSAVNENIALSELIDQTDCITEGIVSGEELVFISNLLEEDAYFIAELYKRRWEIELFFKFIKQHSNASHLVSRTENGIKVMLYVTMILAMLIIVYKKKNNIKSFKIAKQKFSIELENEIIRKIVVLCGGNPEKAIHLFGYD